MVRRILKNILFLLLVLFSINFTFKSFGFVIPINIFNIIVTTVLGIPGLIALIVIKIFVF